MEKFEFDLATLKNIMTKVYLKAVNSYHDLSDSIVDEVISDFIEDKKKKLSWDTVLSQKKEDLDCIKKAFLCPVSRHDLSWTSTTAYDFSRQSDSESINYSPLPSFYDYNILSNSTNSNITVVSTLNVN